jgi:transposase
MAGITRPPYPAAFRVEAVRLVRDGGVSARQVARDVDVNPDTLRSWVKRADIDAGRREGSTTDERDELTRLRRENRLLKEEREILKNGRARRRLLLNAETPVG